MDRRGTYEVSQPNQRRASVTGCLGGALSAAIPRDTLAAVDWPECPVASAEVRREQQRAADGPQP